MKQVKRTDSLFYMAVQPVALCFAASVWHQCSDAVASSRVITGKRFVKLFAGPPHNARMPQQAGCYDFFEPVGGARVALLECERAEIRKPISE